MCLNLLVNARKNSILSLPVHLMRWPRLIVYLSWYLKNSCSCQVAGLCSSIRHATITRIFLFINRSVTTGPQFFPFLYIPMKKTELRKIYREKRMALSEKERIKLDDLLLIQFQSADIPFIDALMTYWPIEENN